MQNELYQNAERESNLVLRAPNPMEKAASAYIK
jgi:hypothetical protein